MTELKPCPFCGKKAEIKRRVLNDGYYVMCSNSDCEMMVYTKPMPTEKAAIKLWNKRDDDHND